MKSVMNAHFSNVPGAQVPRSSFQRDFGYKTAMEFDLLYPIFVEEMLPGDTANVNMHAIARLATPLHPIMDNIYLDTFFFSIPYRLVWDNWEKFNGQQDNPNDSIDYLIPTVTSPSATGWAEDSIHDYMDIPPGVPDLEHSSLWHRAYNLVFNEWFRDENLIQSVPVPKDDGPDPDNTYKLLTRGKRHDYWTSCLPFAQKDYGNPVLLPLGSTAPVAFDGTTGQTTQVNNSAGAATYLDASTANLTLGASPTTGGGPLYADLTNATAATINQLREAFQIQKMYERDARGGSRYVEIIKSHFGVTTPSQGWRSEYLGGGSTPIAVQQVPQTAEGTDPVGSLGAFATSRIDGNGFTKSFTEHCLVLGIICARADLTYQQGLPRKYSRSTRFDHYFPALAHLGEQAVLQKEIYASGVPAEDDTVFGYQERWAEMRYSKSAITGAMRSSHSATLDPWHLCQDFANAPTLSEQFIQQDTPIERVVAVPTAKKIILDTYFQFKHARPLPTYSVPGLIDHF